jgi:hypothetical protein
MAAPLSFYLEQADAAARSAASATLDNQREIFLRSEKTWREIAERTAATAMSRAERDAATAVAAQERQTEHAHGS